MSVLGILSCSRNYEDSSIEREVEVFNKFIRTPDGKIVDQLPKEVFDKIKEDLKRDKKYTLLSSIEASYKLSSNKKMAVNKSKISLGSYTKVTTTNSSSSVTFAYNGHLQNLGWQGWKSLGYMSGTTGESRRMEALQFTSSTYFPLEVRGHVQNIGWMPWVGLNDIVGTTGDHLRLEAVQLNVPSTYATNVYYQAYVQDIGWMPLVRNGEIAGTTGQSRRMEAFRLYMYIIF
ncbi:hypothetical protein PG623_02515 [Riemerella anatipestifer]|nr:hypothetical protein [Riemerella anatipestifer]MDY3520439.1 hypothetical protein [Riemerella anatipestifer]MDY3532508.1 hypothetical protein [Riemerella anatipestifer]MDY3534937.1 hypothetical protein [Riemerella anatipestifer]